MDNEGDLLNFHAFIQSISIKQLFYSSKELFNASKAYKKNKLINKLDKNITGPKCSQKNQSILKQKKGSQNIFKILNKNNDKPTGINEWNRLYHFDEKSWEYIFMVLLKLQNVQSSDGF